MIDKVCFILSDDYQYIYVDELLKTIEKPTMIIRAKGKTTFTTSVKRFIINCIMRFEQSTSGQLKPFTLKITPNYTDINPDALTNTLIVNLTDSTFNISSSNEQLTLLASYDEKRTSVKIEDLIWHNKKRAIKLTTALSQNEYLSYTTCNNNIFLTVRYNNLIAVMNDLLFYSITKCLK